MLKKMFYPHKKPSTTVHRPWGYYKKFLNEKNDETCCWLKVIVIKPGKRLSLQRHNSRSEKWIVISGKGVASLNKHRAPVSIGTTVDIPLGASHRMENTGTKYLKFIEIAFGKALSERDIERLEDDYGRSHP